MDQINKHEAILKKQISNENLNKAITTCDKQEKLHDLSDFKTTKDLELYDSILKFISTKSKFLFSKEFFSEPLENADLVKADVDNEEVYPCPPLIEHFMGLPNKEARQHLFDYLEIGDIVIVNVISLTERGLLANLICFDNQKRRDIEHLKIIAFCSTHDLQQYLGPRNMSLFQPNDFIRCTIKSIDKIKESCDVCFTPLIDITVMNTTKKLGLINSDDLPYYQKRLEYYDQRSYTYNEIIKYEKSFHNSASINLLASDLKLNRSPKLSLMKGLFNYEIKEGDTAVAMRKQQSRSLALQSVSKGINLFKENKTSDAMLNYNKALSIDEENVEAFVARGALYANMGDWNKAIEDFEKALSFDPKHLNARKYLFEVIMDRAIKFEKTEAYEDALEYYGKLLEFKDFISTKIDIIQTKIIEIEEKKKKMDSIGYYGPHLPSKPSKTGVEKSKSKKHKKKKKKGKKRASSTSSSVSNSSSSSSSSNSVQIISKPKETNDKRDKSRDLERSRSRKSHSRDRHSKKRLSSPIRKIESKNFKSDRSNEYCKERERLSKSFTSTSSTSKPIQQQAKKSHQQKDDEEDLEEFYLKLKQKSISNIKK